MLQQIVACFVAASAGVTFEIGGDGPSTPTSTQPPGVIEEEQHSWECVWKCHTATPVAHMAFSPDGTLFATAGKADRLVKIWFEHKPRKSLLQK